MLTVLSVTAAAALVVIVCVRAVEGVVDVLSRSTHGPLSTSTTWGEYNPGYAYDPGFEDEPL